MLLDFHFLKAKYNMRVTGVVHGGAHYLEEYDTYKACGVERIVAIEPCGPAFKILIERFGNYPDVKLFHHALGDERGSARMNVEHDNGGQSNSLLKPKLHLIQHSNIQFTTTEEVDVELLDNLDFDRSQYQMLCLDVQGYEGYVLRGGIETLKHIDYVYAELNFAETYENCTQIDELKSILKDFELVEQVKVGCWGDGLFIRRSKLIA